MPSELLLDPGIRDWALLPIAVVTLLLQLIRHYVTLLLKGQPKVEAAFQREGQIVARSNYSRTNRGWIPAAALDERRRLFSSKEKVDTCIPGLYRTDPQLPRIGLLAEEPKSDQGNPMMSMMADPSAMRTMASTQMMSIGPHFAMMSWVSHFFSGFVIAKLPFPLTSRFRGMLQRGVDAPTLDVTYITSVCGYFLIMFGIRGIITLVLGEQSEADDAEAMKQMTSGMGMAGRPGGQVDMKAVFKSELDNWSEAFTQHEFQLSRVEEKLLRLRHPAC
eukprot:TRINITY_DN60144_c0_g1_i1.p1 TRINITY_DN60144_c0_g1~~TRINITY_DN60144_c0_g1_i1.p1  ORF type:complete len:276 (+),score=114.28 TRINITY_DN60144_c0_g1_i1:68-895(+)